MERREFINESFARVGNALTRIPNTQTRIQQQSKDRSLFTVNLRYQDTAVPAGNQFTFSYGSFRLQSDAYLRKVVVSGYSVTSALVYQDLGARIEFQVSSSVIGAQPYQANLNPGVDISPTVFSWYMPKRGYLELDFGGDNSLLLPGNTEFLVNALCHGPFALNDRIYLYAQLTFEG